MDLGLVYKTITWYTIISCQVIGSDSKYLLVWINTWRVYQVLHVVAFPLVRTSTQNCSHNYLTGQLNKLAEKNDTWYCNFR